MQGRWEGDGWRQTGSTKQTFKERVTVEEKIGGAFLLLDAKATVTGSEDLPPALAVSIIGYDEASKSYKAKTLVPDASWTWRPPCLRSKPFNGVLATPGGEMRYRIKRSGDEWRETVERKGGTTGMDHRLGTQHEKSIAQERHKGLSRSRPPVACLKP